MRVTNSMMVATTKINIGGNKNSVDNLNRRMSSQKKIIKPSDDPIIAIRSLRLRSSLSTIDQFYERNIPDTESWMDVTETALVNMKDIVSKAYEQVVYGTTDSLNNENRLTIQKELKALQEQVYTEGNAEYAGRTVFTGHKTNRKVTFTSDEDAANSNYSITEHLSYKNTESNKFYANRITDTTLTTLTGKDASSGAYATDLTVPQEYELKRVRLAYDDLDATGTSVKVKYEVKQADGTTRTAEIGISSDENGKSATTVGDYTFTQESDGTITITDRDGTPVIFAPSDITKVYPIGATGTDITSQLTKTATGYKVTDGAGTELGTVTSTTHGLQLAISDSFSFTYNTGDTAAAEKQYEAISKSSDNQLFFDTESGQLIMANALADQLESRRADIEVSYNKKGFDVGELRPENYFDCVNNTDPKNPLTYKNFDDNGDWITEGIYYNIANKQPMQINTEARDAFDANIYRDMDELIDAVNMAIDAQNAVTSIQEKLDSGLYPGDESRLKGWLDSARKQLDYATQNMHDTFSQGITRFQGYLDHVTMAVTDSGSRGERVALTKTRMNVQQTTFEELKSTNEDAELSELAIDYSAAYVSYQAALQAAGKIGKMTLLDYI